MKTCYTLLLCFLSSFHLSADCGNGISVFPKNELSETGVLLIEAYGWGKPLRIIKQLDKEYRIYLESRYHNVDLKIEELYHGEIGVIQALFSPQTVLIPNEKYTLRVEGKIDSTKVEKYFKKWDSDLGQFKLQEFIIKCDEDTLISELIVPPYLKSKLLFHFGCGPSINAIFQFEMNKNFSNLIKTEVIDLSTNQSRIAYLKTYKNEIRVGRDMCYGYFNHDQSKNYKVRFQFIDQSGKNISEWTEWIVYSSPNDEKYNFHKQNDQLFNSRF